MRKLLVLAILVPFLFGGCFLTNVSLMGRQRTSLQEHVLSGKGQAKILVLPISGEITNYEKEGGLLGLIKEPSTVVQVDSILKKAADDEDIRAVILRINSPGGGVTASDIVYQLITDYKEKKGVKVLAYMMDVAASGGYYIASSADKLVAHPTTVTGSIGVVMFNLNFSGLMQKIGVADATVKSGPYKDIGSPIRPQTDKDVAIIQSVIDDMLARFKEVVDKGRPNLTRADVDRLADGRVYSARQALDNGLVDELGSFEKAIEDAKAMAGVSEAKVVIYRSYSQDPDDNIYARTPLVPQVNLVNIDAGSFMSLSTPRFMYLWAPGLPEVIGPAER